MNSTRDYRAQVMAAIKASKYFDRHEAFEAFDALDKMVRQGTMQGVIGHMEDQLTAYKAMPIADAEKVKQREDIIEWLHEYHAYTYRIWEAGAYHKTYAYHLTIENARINEELRQKDARILMLEKIIEETNGSK